MEINLNYLYNFFDGDKKAVVEVVEAFFVESSKLMTNLTKATQSRDWESVSRHAHSLKSNFAALGIHELKELAYQLEIMSKNSNFSSSDIEFLAQQLISSTQQATILLRNAVTKF